MPPETAYTAEALGPGDDRGRRRRRGHVLNVVDFDRALGQALDEGAQNLVVDLTGVTFIDSSGLSSLLTASARARERRTVALVLAEGEPPSIFRFRGVDRLLSLYPSREAALEGLRR